MKIPALEIAMAVPGMKLYPGVFEKESVGGSETAGYMMARALAKRGHQVYFFCNIDKPAEDDLKVHFFPINMFLEHAANIPHDITIVQRMPELFYRQTESKLNVLWMHDLPLGRQGAVVRGASWNVDGMFLLSDFHAKRYKEVYGLSDETIWRSRNGIDLDLVAAAPEVAERDKAILYAARPERGLENLLKMMPEVIKRHPDAKLRLCTYDNTAEQLASYYAKINILTARLEPNVEFLGHLTKAQLYAQMKKASVYAYPVPAPENPLCHFAEISCIAAMEAQACGLPIVTMEHGALPETVAPNAGFLVKGKPWEEEPRREFIERLCYFLEDPSAVRFCGNAGRDRAAGLGWDPVAEEWEQKFVTEIKKRNDFDTEIGARRLARHFWRHSDIFAMVELSAHCEHEEVVKEVAELYAPFSFIDSPEETKTQYAKIGATHDDRVFEAIKYEPRYDVLKKWVLGHRKTIKSVLDYGCGLGGYATFLAQDTGVSVTAYDIDQATIDIAQRMKVKFDPENKANVTFIAGTHDQLAQHLEPEFDCATIQELLEHVKDPGAVIEAVESRVKKDGFVYITVPFGPWEYSSYHTYPHRCHVHTFDKHDIRDILGKKPELTIHALMTGQSPELDRSLGWWIISYRADHEPVGKIDWERKLWLQRPRQTLSACIMAGGSAVEETLHWMIRPLQHLADEIIVADTGLTEESRRILGQYPVTIVPSVDPKTEGFETARNDSIAKAKGDWIFWIDTDERLLEPEKIHKYLRQNELNGYGVQQHHFAVDTKWFPDLPVRLFRNRTGVRFFGMIHEHPEQELNMGPGLSIVAGDINIAHVGYLIEAVRKDRFNRNWPMLQADLKKYPKRDLQKHFIIRDTMLLVQNSLQRTNGILSDKMKEKLEEVIELYRDHFLDKPVHSKNLDVVEYYSQAVALLGRGFEVAFALESAKDQVVGQLAPQKVRFDTEEDCQRFMTARITSKIKPFTANDY